jgi:hypothetical protein
MVRYHGVFAPRHKKRAEIIEEAPIRRPPEEEFKSLKSNDFDQSVVW